MAVGLMAAFLAVAVFLSNEAVKEVITAETHRADASARLESDRVKIDVASGDSVLLRTLAAGDPQQRRAAIQADVHETRVAHELRPEDARLNAEIADHQHEADHANTQHVDYELAAVGLQVGIVLASVSIIARRRWLLGAGGAVATAGVCSSWPACSLEEGLRPAPSRAFPTAVHEDRPTLGEVELTVPALRTHSGWLTAVELRLELVPEPDGDLLRRVALREPALQRHRLVALGVMGQLQPGGLHRRAQLLAWPGRGCGTGRAGARGGCRPRRAPARRRRCP